MSSENHPAVGPEPRFLEQPMEGDWGAQLTCTESTTLHGKWSCLRRNVFVALGIINQ